MEKILYGECTSFTRVVGKNAAERWRENPYTSSTEPVERTTGADVARLALLSKLLLNILRRPTLISKNWPVICIRLLMRRQNVRCKTSTKHYYGEVFVRINLNSLRPSVE